MIRAWFFLGLVLGGCECKKTSSSDPHAVPARIVSISPSVTEALFAVGAGPQMVGRSRFCNQPEAAAALPVVGGYSDPNLETILALAPDLVVGAYGPAGASISTQLAAHGIPTLFPRTESWDDVGAMLRSLGERTGHAEQAGQVVESLNQDTAAAEAEFRAKPVVRVLLVFGVSPIFVAGPGGFPDEMVKRAHAENVVREGGAYPSLPAERLVALDPDVVVNLAMYETTGLRRITADTPGWRELAAVRAGRVAELQNDAALRPGPRLAEGLRALGAVIHQLGDDAARARVEQP